VLDERLSPEVLEPAAEITSRPARARVRDRPSNDMTDNRAEQVANVLLTVAAVGVAVYVIKTPPLRRMAWRLAVTALTGALPTWFEREVRDAWHASGHRTI
jgi:hypothetical protein